MAIENLMNHRARVWRPTQTRGDYAEIVNTWELVTDPTRLNCRPAPINWRLKDEGPGEQSTPTDNRRWYMTKDTDVQKFDVIEVYAGPDAPQNVRVLDATFPSKPAQGGHHYRLNVEPWEGVLPAYEEES